MKAFHQVLFYLRQFKQGEMLLFGFINPFYLYKSKHMSIYMDVIKMELIKVFLFLYICIQGTVQEARRNSVRYHRESILQSGQSVECWGSWGYNGGAGEGY